MLNQGVISNQSNQNFIGSKQNHNHQNHKGGDFNKSHSFNKNQQFQQFISLLLPLLQQLISQLSHDDVVCQPPLQEINFDEGFPEPITHLGSGRDLPIRSIEFSSDGYQGVLENGTGFQASVAPGGPDQRPRIDGQIVVKAEYTNDTATYTLENGTTLTGLKPFNPSL